MAIVLTVKEIAAKALRGPGTGALRAGLRSKGTVGTRASPRSKAVLKSLADAER